MDSLSFVHRPRDPDVRNVVMCILGIGLRWCPSNLGKFRTISEEVASSDAWNPRTALGSGQVSLQRVSM